MPWNTGDSGNDQGHNPWSGGRRPGRPEPSRGTGGDGGGGWGGGAQDIEALIARVQAWLRDLLPGGSSGRRGIVLLGIVVVAIWLASGFYRVQPDEQGVVMRFGAFTRLTAPGLNYHIPWPVETVDLPAVTRINRIDIGYRGGPDAGSHDLASRDVPAESLMLTGDENIIDINFSVFWHISNAPDYLFNTRNPDATVKDAAESVMREVIGRTPIQPALTGARASIEQQVKDGTQKILNSYGAGVELTQVQLQRVDPPAAVIDSFRDVQRATTDAERMRNEAEAYRNDVVPRARGEAAVIVAGADADRQASIALAAGESQRFLSVLSAYDSAKQVTLQRLYIETMQAVLSKAQTLVLDDGTKGLMPLLPLQGFTTPPPAAAPSAPSATAATPATAAKGAAQ